MSNKGPNLIKRYTDNFYIIIKLVEYSPKRVAMWDGVKGKMVIMASSIEYGVTEKKSWQVCPI